MNIFGITLAFSPDEVISEVENAIKQKKAGYVCVVDSSVLTRTYYEPDYRKVVNGALVNSCDGSSIALMKKMIYGGQPQVYNGPQIFSKYIETGYKQVVLGNTEEMFSAVKNMLQKEGKWKGQLIHIPLPFMKVEDFDYSGIAAQINDIEPDIIWVSLGNPKQERFMGLMLPHIKQGVMFGIGAALNFCTGNLKLPSFHIGPMKFIWLTRIFQDPKRQIKANWMVLKAYPRLYWRERKNRNNNK